MPTSKSKKKPRKKRRPHPGYAVQAGYPHFGQIPQDLLKDPNAPDAPVRLYGVLHTWVGEKSLKKRMFREVTQKQLGQDIGRHRNRIHHWMVWLEAEGWIEIRPQGLNKPHIIILFGKKQK